MRPIVFYELRVAFGITALLPLLVLPAYALYSGAVWASRAEIVPPMLEITRAFSLLLPLISGLASAHLMTVEREAGFDEIRRTYREASWWVPLMRASVALLFVCLSGVIAGGLVGIIYGNVDLGGVLLPALPSVFYLGALALFVNNASGSYWASAGVIVGYWIGDYLSGGRHSQVLFLFNSLSPLPGIDPTANRAALITAAVGLTAGNILFSTLRRRGSFGR